MNSFDFLIIYLTCGAPLGVFYFLKNRKEQNDVWFWLKTFFTFIFWMPFAFQLLKQNKAKRKLLTDGNFLPSKDDKTETEIYLFQKQLEEILQKSGWQISLFEFRETFERYVGLTLAKNFEKGKTRVTKKDFFQIADNRNAEIGTICLNRRNLKRLTFHQIQARQDFFQIIRQLSEFASDQGKFLDCVKDFLRLIKDVDAQTEIVNVVFGKTPDKKDFAPQPSEKFLWNMEIRDSPQLKPTTLQLQSLTATANSSAKD